MWYTTELTNITYLYLFTLSALSSIIIALYQQKRHMVSVMKGCSWKLCIPQNIILSHILNFTFLGSYISRHH